MTTATYHVTGMTCGHCVSAVRDELGALVGVQDVTVDLPTGRVQVTGDSELPRDQVVAAVDEDGYQLADVPHNVDSPGHAGTQRSASDR